MKMLSYDACFLIIKDGGKNFGIAKLQTNNTLNIKIEIFMKKEKTEIMKAKFKVKTRIILETHTLEDFNGYCMTIKAESIMVIQKNQTEKLVLVDIKDNIKKQ